MCLDVDGLCYLRPSLLQDSRTRCAAGTRLDCSNSSPSCGVVHLVSICINFKSSSIKTIKDRLVSFLERAINLTSSKCIPVFSMTASQLMRLAWTLCQRRDTCIKFIGGLWALQDTLWSEIGILEILLDLCALRRLYVWLGSQLGKQEGIWQQVSPCRLPVVNSFSRPFIKGLHRFDMK